MTPGATPTPGWTEADVIRRGVRVHRMLARMANTAAPMKENAHDR